MNIYTLLSALVISSSLSSDGANIVLNGDFETGDLTSWVAPSFSGVEQSRSQIANAFDGTNFAIGNPSPFPSSSSPRLEPFTNSIFTWLAHKPLIRTLPLKWMSSMGLARLVTATF